MGKQIKDAGSVACNSTRATEDAELRRPAAVSEPAALGGDQNRLRAIDGAELAVDVV
jgi:hypothetical protein